MDMEARKIKEVVTQMIIDGELQFNVDISNNSGNKSRDESIKLKIELQVLDFVDNILVEVENETYLHLK